MLLPYLFVVDSRDGSFPERRGILRDREDPKVPGAANLTGTVGKADLETFRAGLEARFPKPRCRVSTAWAKSWSAVANNLRGLERDR